MKKLAFCLVVLLAAGCVETSVQPLTRSSFKISTRAEDLCGAKGTREIAFREAAIEVITRGQDRFIVVGDNAKSQITGATFTAYGGLDTFGVNTQEMVIQIVEKGDAHYRDALSARETLGPDWQAIVAKGPAAACF